MPSAGLACCSDVRCTPTQLSSGHSPPKHITTFVSSWVVRHFDAVKYLPLWANTLPA